MAESKIPTIGFIGAGKMATALARGWKRARLIKADQIFASDPIPEARKHFERTVKATAAESNREVVEKSDLIVLAVKPQHMPEVLEEIAPVIDQNRHLVISIAAGVTLTQIRDGIGHDNRVIRVMPNTPCQVGASASAYAASLTATKEDLELVERLLNAVGLAFRLPEKMLDAVTGLSGSGPAFVYMIIEALSDGGVNMGLPRDVATELAAQTVFGTAKMVLDTAKHPGQLKDMVTSPAGTTIAGVHALERGGLRAALMNAVQAATERARELAKE